jgi:hypothetical protein
MEFALSPAAVENVGMSNVTRIVSQIESGGPSITERRLAGGSTVLARGCLVRIGRMVVKGNLDSR